MRNIIYYQIKIKENKVIMEDLNSLLIFEDILGGISFL